MQFFDRCSEYAFLRSCHLSKDSKGSRELVMGVLEERAYRSGNSQCRGPGEEMGLASSRNSKQCERKGGVRRGERS